MTVESEVPDRSTHVLIVDDEPHNRSLLEVMLTPEGYHLDTAASGEEALAMVAQNPPDVILLDIMMPGMDGYQVAEKLKSNLATKKIPVIMVTALHDRAAKLLGLNAGAEEFLTKPVDREELRVRVRNLSRLKASGEVQNEVLAERAALLDLAQDAIVVRDMDDRIVFWSRGAEVMYGWSGKEALGTVIHDLLRTEFAGPIDDIEGTLVREGRWEGEVVHHKRDGARLIVAARWALERDEEGIPLRVLSIDNDISDRKQAEQVRKDQMQFKEEFLSHVSHELRSPLTAIKQFTSILLGGLAGELNTEQHEYQQIVMKNIHQLQSMIDDVLEVTRLETGKLTIERERVSIADAVRDTFETLQVTARSKGVTLSHDVPVDLPAAHADPTRLRQILIILFENAVKFTEAGGRAHIQARRMQDTPQSLLFEVSDTGCGISPEMTQRIFERLYQASASSQASRKGLGLGLYICKELVSRQGGQLWVKRKPKPGATFCFTLPVFSVADVISPLLKNDEWPRESIALLTVETRLPSAWPSKESREEWSYEIRTLVERCLLPDLDVLLPRLGVGVKGERVFIAAFADENGASVLANRIQDQFTRLPKPKLSGLTLLVSYRMLETLPRDADASTEGIATRMAAVLEHAIKDESTLEAA